MLTKQVLFRVLWILFILLYGNPIFTLVAVSHIYAQNPPQKLSEKELKIVEDEAKQTAVVWNENSYRRAQTLYQKTAQHWLQIGDFQRYAACLREAARLNISLNELDVAWRMLLNSLFAERKSRNIAGESETLSFLTLIALWRKDLKSAERLQKEAVVLAEKSKQPETIARASFAAAEFFYRNQRNLPLMMELQEKSLRFFRAANDRTGEAQTLTMLAYTAVMNNDRVKGQEYATEAINLARSTGNQRDLAFALLASGDAYQRVGNWQEAYQAFKEAESIYPENLDLNEKAILFVRFGFHYETFNDLIQARSYFQKARELFIKRGNLYGNSELATRIGQISLQLGEEKEALRNFNEGLQVGLQSNDQYSLAYAYENIGELYFLKQEYKNAFSYYQKALMNFDKVGIKHAVASVKEKIGKLHLRLDNQRLAEKFYLEALQINQDIRNRVGKASNLYNLAQLHKSDKQIEKSLSEIDECLLLTDFLHGETANKKLQRSFLADMFERHEFYINALMETHRQNPHENFAVRAFQAAEKSRARSMIENLSLSEANFTKDANPETVKREKEIRVLLNTKADKLTDLLSQNAEMSETEKISNEINELELELEEIKANLKQSSPIYSAIRNPAPFDVADFQQNVLDENSLLLEFSLGKEESYLWLVSKTEFSSYVLPPREQIEAKIQKLREFLASRQKIKGEEIETYQARIVKAENDYWLAAKQLSDELFGQLSDKFEKKRLIIVPDGKLNYFPVSALPLPNSETGDPILLSHEVVYQPSASTLSILSKSQNQMPPAAKNLLVFSDPIFTKDDSRILSNKAEENHYMEPAALESFRFVESLNSLARLPDSKTEADSIIEIFGRSSTDNYSGFAASREQLLNARTADYRILHFATHGLIDEERPELSGIVMSRFAENGQKLDEFVRLHDIYGMNLSANLVVLSACETGIGKEVRGEGLMSLNNAFLQVGAKTVMSSLWKVEDKATLELMKNFYQSLANENTTPSKALQQAQIKMWESGRYKSPFYWAAFTVQGDFRRAPDFSRDFPYTIVFSAAGLGGLVFGMFWLYERKRRNSRLLNRK